jgi:hypothetical protein
MSRRQRTGSHWTLRGFEQLELRDMLSGHALVSAFAQANHVVPQVNSHVLTAASTAQAVAHNQLFANFAADLGDWHKTTLTATLADPNNTAAAGTVTYQTGTVDRVAQTTFSVSVTGAAASSTLNVSIGTTVVGQLTTDATGAGTLVLSSNPTGTQQALPTNFPTTIDKGTAVSVDTLTGNLTAATDTGDGCSISHGTSLAATLTDPNNTSATGTIKYHTYIEDGVTQTVFSISVSGAAASSTLDVTIGTTVVGQLTTDSTGAGTLVWASNPTGTQQALPTNFPTTIDVGTTVSVGTLGGTLATSSYGSAHSHFRRH